MRVVFDTNVLLAGIATRGVCEMLLDTCLGSPDFTVVVSQHILAETARHLADKFGVPQDKVSLAIDTLRGQTEMVAPATVPSGACRDPDDLPVLGTIVAAAADGLVTGDKDLLVLGQYQGIPILSPRQFYERIQSGTGEPSS